jgi:hypothetical protein
MSFIFFTFSFIFFSKPSPLSSSLNSQTKLKETLKESWNTDVINSYINRFQSNPYQATHQRRNKKKLTFFYLANSNKSESVMSNNILSIEIVFTYKLQLEIFQSRKCLLSDLFLVNTYVRFYEHFSVFGSNIKPKKTYPTYETYHEKHF